MGRDDKGAWFIAIRPAGADARGAKIIKTRPKYTGSRFFAKEAVCDLLDDIRAERSASFAVDKNAVTEDGICWHRILTKHPLRVE